MDQEEIYSRRESNSEGEYQPRIRSCNCCSTPGRSVQQIHEGISLAQQLTYFPLMMTILMASIWGMMMGIALSGEGSSDFSDGGAAPAAQKQEKQKVVKLMQRQKKAQPTTQQTFRTTAISDITLPDFNELDVKDLAPVVEAAAPTMSAAGQ